MNELIPGFLIAYSDSSFTNPHEVVRPDDPPECTGNFTHMGAKYWGFETSRHRATTLDDREDVFHFNDDAYHWLHIGLKRPALIDTITVSTKWFTGNQVPEIAIELINASSRNEVVTRTTLAPDSEATFTIEPTAATECLVRCYHEGGIARINLMGQVAGNDIEYNNLLTNAQVSHVSNEHYGKPQDAVKGTRHVDYMLGWESARSGFGEHAVFHLESPSIISGVIVDTYLHRLNPPLSCHVFGLHAPDTDLETAWQQRPRWRLMFEDGLEVIPDDFADYMQNKNYRQEDTGTPGKFSIDLVRSKAGLWQPVLSFGRLRPDTWHHFRELENRGPFTHLLYIHYPNGGIHGLNIY